MANWVLGGVIGEIVIDEPPDELQIYLGQDKLGMTTPRMVPSRV